MDDPRHIPPGRRVQGGPPSGGAGGGLMKWSQLPVIGTLCILAVIGIHTLDGPAKALCILGGFVFGVLALWMALRAETE